MAKDSSLVPAERIESLILLIRGEKVILDADLAELYGTTTTRLNEQVRRNRKRFPADFMYELTTKEVTALRSQIAISKPLGRGGRRLLTENLQDGRAAYGERILATVSRELTAEFGGGFGYATVNRAIQFGVTTAALNQAVRRNRSRFPRDFMFRLSKEEFAVWMSQTVISNPRLKMGARRLPYAFTEQGVAMLSGVLSGHRSA